MIPAGLQAKVLILVTSPGELCRAWQDWDRAWQDWGRAWQEWDRAWQDSAKLEYIMKNSKFSPAVPDFM
jgi:hypothetical protein